MKFDNLTPSVVTVPLHPVVGLVGRDWSASLNTTPKRISGRNSESHKILALIMHKKLGHSSGQDGNKLQSLLFAFSDIFDKPGPEDCSMPVQYHIENGESKPVVKRLYCIPFITK